MFRPVCFSPHLNVYESKCVDYNFNLSLPTFPIKQQLDTSTRD